MLKLYTDIITHGLPIIEAVALGLVPMLVLMAIIDFIVDKFAKRSGDV